MNSSDVKVDGRAIAVVGAGTLGRQIALSFATRGGEVRICDPNSDATAAAMAYISANLAQAADAVGGQPGRIVTTQDLGRAVDGVWLAVESVPENPEIKTQVFAELDRRAPPDAILASNSSSIPTSRINGRVKAPDRVVNMHFYLGKAAVEVMSCGQTSEQVIAFLMKMLPRYGLIPFEVKKESVGFIYNRIWAAIKREALAIVAEEVATAQEVDEIYCLVNNTERGPFRRMDAVGLDVVLDIERIYAAERAGLPSGPRQLLERYIAQGRLGVKSARGFYQDYA